MSVPWKPAAGAYWNEPSSFTVIGAPWMLKSSLVTEVGSMPWSLANTPGADTFKTWPGATV